MRHEQRAREKTSWTVIHSKKAERPLLWHQAKEYRPMVDAHKSPHEITGEWIRFISTNKGKVAFATSVINGNDRADIDRA